MNPKEPHSFEDLSAWLKHIPILTGFRAPPCPEGRKRHSTAESVWLSLTQFERPFVSAIEQAADKLWHLEAEAFQGLLPEAESLLQLRIETADELIEEFLTKQEPPFVYPDGSFQEVVHWLLVDWWKRGGIRRASVNYFLRD